MNSVHSPPSIDGFNLEIIKPEPINHTDINSKTVARDGICKALNCLNCTHFNKSLKRKSKHRKVIKQLSPPDGNC